MEEKGRGSLGGGKMETLGAERIISLASDVKRFQPRGGRGTVRLGVEGWGHAQLFVLF